MSHFACDKIQGFRNDLFEVRDLCNLPGMKISASELSIIIEHFLKVGDTPKIIHAITRKTTAHYVVHAAACHGFQYMDCWFQHIFITCCETPEQKFNRH